eukprot:3367165-Prymnesium_polylepis.1
MCARCASAPDARSKADRATRGKTADVARWASDPALATPTAENASPGPPGRLVVRPCFVCH